MAADKDFALLTSDDDVSMDALRGVKRYRRPTTSRVAEFRHWFVVSDAMDLPRVAEVVKEANRLRKLRGLLIRHATDARFATAMLERASLHTLAHTLVHSDVSVFRRVIEAWVVGAQDRLIADATMMDGTLFVRTCGLDLLEVEASELRALRRVDESDLPHFEIDVDGSYLHWPAGDVHLNLEAIRAITDPELREKLRAERLVYDEALGYAVRSLREAAGLRQCDIGGLSTKQVGRIERGEAHPRVESLRRLAEAHGLSTNEYLDRLAAECPRR